MVLTRADREWIEGRALAAGFNLAGLAAVPPIDSQAAKQADRRFADWIAADHAGDMDWLKRTDADGNLVRGDVRRAIPWARSVLVCAIDYDADAPLSIDPADPRSGWIARYAWSGRPSSVHGHETEGSDYHDVLLPRLKAIEAELQSRFGADCLTRCYVDTGPLVERDFAARAGVGWIGKNTCVLNGEKGSWLLLGVLITSLDLAPDAQPVVAADRCGTCTRCIDACPTDALVAPREMDASRCIAYLTIEKKGSIPEDLRSLMGRQVFGCDICQDVCPWNTHKRNSEKSASPLHAPATSTHALPPRRQLINPALGWLASLDGPAFNRWFRGSPLERTRRRRILRNVAIAMGNSGDGSFLPQLDAWATGNDDVLADAASWAALRLHAVSSPSHAEDIPPRKLDSMASEQTTAVSAPPPSIPEPREDTAAIASAGEEAVTPDLIAARAVPVAEGGTWEQVIALGRYMTKTEVHTYAFSVAAQVILSLFPFIVLLLTLARSVFHSTHMVDVVGEMMTNFLPNNQDFVMRNMRLLANSHTQTKLVSIVMLVITSTGVFLPLEVALNSVWGVTKNRSYLHNQFVSVGLAIGVGALAMASVALTTGQRTVLNWIFLGHTNNIVYTLVGHGFLKICAVMASIGLFFLIYWLLPNRKVPALAVLPTAIVMGLLWELAKYLYILALPHLDFRSVYGPFEVSVGLIMWAFLSGLLLLAGAYVSATRHALREAHAADRLHEEEAA